jgi:chromosomal replication initiation ATPase DnaA
MISAQKQLNECLKWAADTYGVDPDDILSPSRKKEVVQARHAAIRRMVFLMPKVSVQRLALLFNRDRSTIIYALRLGKQKRFKATPWMEGATA